MQGGPSIGRSGGVTRCRNSHLALCVLERVQRCDVQGIAKPENHPLAWTVAAKRCLCPTRGLWEHCWEHFRARPSETRVDTGIAALSAQSLTLRQQKTTKPLISGAFLFFASLGMHTQCAIGFWLWLDEIGLHQACGTCERHPLSRQRRVFCLASVGLEHGKSKRLPGHLLLPVRC